MSSWGCEHENYELVFKYAARGQRRFRYACLDCGRFIGDWQEEGEFTAKERREARQYDGATERKAAEKLREQQRADREKQDAAWWKQYEEYINTNPEWKARRRLVIERARGMCEGCGKAPAAHVHHLTYEHLGAEFLWELKAVCIQCHERLHPHRKGTMRHG